MNWILAFTLLLTLSSQTLAQNGYSYHQPIKPFNGGTTKYPGTTQPERPGIGITSNKYPDSQQTSGPQEPGERPGSQKPGGAQSPRGYPDIPGLSGYPGGQQPGRYPGTHGVRIHQGSSGYSETQRQSGPGAGPFTGYPSGRPAGPPFPQRPGGIGSQGPSGHLGGQRFDGHPGSQQGDGSQRPSGYPDAQRPSSRQGPAEYPGIQRPSGPAAGVFNGFSSGRPEPTFSHPHSSIDFQSPIGPQRPTGTEAPNSPQGSSGLQRPTGPQRPIGSQITSRPQGSQGPTGYSGQPNAGYPSGRPQGPTFPSAQRTGDSEIHETHGSFPRQGFPSLLQPGSSQGTSGYPGGQVSSEMQGPSASQDPELRQQKPYSNIQSPSKPPSSYIPPIGSQGSDDTHGGSQRPSKPQGAGTPQESRGSQGPNGNQGVNRPQEYDGHEGPRAPPSPMYPRPGGRIQGSGEPKAPGDAGSRGIGKPSRTYLPGQVSPVVSHPVEPGFSGIPITPDASGRPGVPGTYRGSNFPSLPGGPVSPGVPSTPSSPGIPGVPGGSFSGVPIGPFPGIGGAGIFGEGKYEGDYSAIPGEPDIDYPIHSVIPETSFNCDQQQYPGYYADVETRCQVFHICANNKTYDFLCPNGTVFHQEYLICVWWNQFDCNSAPSLYGINANIFDYFIIGQLPGSVSSGALSSSGFPEQGSSSGYPGTQGPGTGDRHLTSQGPSGPQQSIRPMGPSGLQELGTQQGPTGSQGSGESEGPRGSAIYPQGPSSAPLEPQQPNTSFLGSGRPGTPSREYLPQVSR